MQDNKLTRKEVPFWYFLITELEFFITSEPEEPDKKPIFFNLNLLVQIIF